ncbi:MAG TPA: hypothetical protein VG488_00600 [Candidatus Angelobacter sp.]|jgi:hypothetical protein|nr:hypothetical protein [Candidatus Angelobacter sp.]
MIPETQINEFVDRLKSAAGTNLESILLYGSAASEDFHAEYSDVNVLCIVRELSAPALQALAPAVNWWTKSKHPAPLIFTWEELNHSADVFPIEMLDMQRRHRLLHGADVLKSVRVPLDLHRVQLEHDLRTKLLLLRQHYLSAAGDNKKIMHLMLGSVSSFITLFRHAQIAMGEQPPEPKRKVVELLAEKLRFDPGPFFDLLDIREHHLKPETSDAQDAFSRYLRAIEAVIRAVDNL